jgi:hypothetical protein
VAGFCLAFNPQRFERQLEDFHLLLQFGDSVRKPKLHPVFFRYQLLLSGRASNLIWLFRKTRFSQPINQVLHVFCAFENGYPFLGAANAVSWI